MVNKIIAGMLIIIMIKGCFRKKEEIRIMKTEKVITEASERLFSAVKKGDIEAMKILIKAGADVNAIDEKGKTALILATEEGHIEIVIELIKAGADVNAEYFEIIALMRAIDKGYVEIVKELIKAGADVNAKVLSVLIEAVTLNNIEIVRELLKAGADVNAEYFGTTALIQAVDEGHIEIIRELIKAGADVNAKTIGCGRKMPALMIAINEGNIEIVRELLRAKADVNASTENGTTALMIASGNGKTEIVRELLKAGADINAVDIDKKTALMIASIRGDTEMVRELLEAGADVNIADKGGHLAVKVWNGYDIVLNYELIRAGAEYEQSHLDEFLIFISEYILKHKSVPIDTLRKYCGYIIERGYLDQQKEINNVLQKYLIRERLGELVYDLIVNISKGAGKINIDARVLIILTDYITNLNIKKAEILMVERYKNSEETPISILDPLTIGHILSLTKVNDEEIAERLVTLKERWIKDGRSILELRGMKEETIISELFGIETRAIEKTELIETGESRGTELRKAIELGNVGLVKEILKYGVDVNVKDVLGETLLMKAIEVDNIEIVRELLKAGAYVNAITKLEVKPYPFVITPNFTVLMKATKRGNIEIVRELLRAGANVNITNGFRYTALMYASEIGDIELVRELLKAGADVNAIDTDKKTALSEASKEGHIEIVRELLKAGAEINIGNYERIALIEASKGGHTEVVY